MPRQRNVRRSRPAATLRPPLPIAATNPDKTKKQSHAIHARRCTRSTVQVSGPKKVGQGLAVVPVGSQWKEMTQKMSSGRSPSRQATRSLVGLSALRGSFMVKCAALVTWRRGAGGCWSRATAAGAAVLS